MGFLGITGYIFGFEDLGSWVNARQIRCLLQVDRGRCRRWLIGTRRPDAEEKHGEDAQHCDQGISFFHAHTPFTG